MEEIFIQDEEIDFNNLDLLKVIIKNISHIVAVYGLDKTIMFHNEAAYEFYNGDKNEIKGKRCYEMVNRNEECLDCFFNKAMETKEIIEGEKFIPEIKKHMKSKYTPVLNKSGEVRFVIVQTKDITQKRELEKKLEENEIRYKKIVNVLPDPVVITVNGKIVFGNEVAHKYFYELIGKDICELLSDSSKTAKKRLNQIVENKTDKATFDYRINLDNKRIIDVEVCSNYLIYQGKPAVMSILRDITERKKELNAAAKIQRGIFEKSISLSNKINVETLYVPAKTVSGDFFYMEKINEDLILGIIGDVSGKGISAALSISAFNVLFHEVILKEQNPYDIINHLNKKVIDYLGERYVAACCFSLDLKKNEAKIAAAGINEFVLQHGNTTMEKRIIKGPFLGMFEDSIFDEQTIHFHRGDKFYFFTDGLESILNNKEIRKKHFEKATPIHVKKYLNKYLKNISDNVEGIKDDCTLLSLEIK
jgi:PAS domain S-box-containing protein